MKGCVCLRKEFKMRELKEDYLIFQKAANYAKIPTTLLKRLDKDGKISALVLDKNQYRYYSIKDLDKLIDNSTKLGFEKIIKIITKKGKAKEE